MLHHLLPAWRGRRVLLAGCKDEISAAMQSLLQEIGARPASIPLCSDSETICRALQAGRGICLIVPALGALLSLPPEAQLAALQTLLGEAREAGTPLVILLASRAGSSAHQADSLGRLMRYADGFSRGLCGDAVSIQAIWHEDLSARSVCLGALSHGARYLMGDRDCTGVFALKKPAE